MDRAAAFFAARGWKVEAGESVFAREQRFAGSDDLRLADLQRFATDVKVSLVVSARGGYGLSRLLDRIDFAAIKARRPVMVGYSDFTAFNLAYLARGGVSFAGPCAIEFGAREPSAYTIEHFFGVLGQQALCNRTRAARTACRRCRAAVGWQSCDGRGADRDAELSARARRHSFSRGRQRARIQTRANVLPAGTCWRFAAAGGDRPRRFLADHADAQRQRLQSRCGNFPPAADQRCARCSPACRSVTRCAS